MNAPAVGKIVFNNPSFSEWERLNRAAIDYKQQRDELAAALTEAVSVIESLGYTSITGRAALAKVKP